MLAINIKLRGKAGTMAPQAKPLLLAPATHMGTSFSSSCSTSEPAPCLWSGKVAEGWPKSLALRRHTGDPEEVLGYGSTQLQLWEIEPANRRSFSLSLPSLIALPSK